MPNGVPTASKSLPFIGMAVLCLATSVFRRDNLVVHLAGPNHPGLGKCRVNGVGTTSHVHCLEPSPARLSLENADPIRLLRFVEVRRSASLWTGETDTPLVAPHKPSLEVSGASVRCSAGKRPHFADAGNHDCVAVYYSINAALVQPGWAGGIRGCALRFADCVGLEFLRCGPRGSYVLGAGYRRADERQRQNLISSQYKSALHP